MPRARLTDEEREERRKARNRFAVSDAAYDHYDPSKEGYGSRAEWAAQAEAMSEGRGTYKRPDGRKSDTVVTADMRALGLSEMPPEIGALRRAMMAAMEKIGGLYKGESSKVRTIIAAFKRLVENY